MSLRRGERRQAETHTSKKDLNRFIEKNRPQNFVVRKIMSSKNTAIHYYVTQVLPSIVFFLAKLVIGDVYLQTHPRLDAGGKKL